MALLGPAEARAKIGGVLWGAGDTPVRDVACPTGSCGTRRHGHRLSCAGRIHMAAKLGPSRSHPMGTRMAHGLGAETCQLSVAQVPGKPACSHSCLRAASGAEGLRLGAGQAVLNISQGVSPGPQTSIQAAGINAGFGPTCGGTCAAFWSRLMPSSVGQGAALSLPSVRAGVSAGNVPTRLLSPLSRCNLPQAAASCGRGGQCWAWHPKN